MTLTALGVPTVRGQVAGRENDPEATRDAPIDGPLLDTFGRGCHRSPNIADRPLQSAVPLLHAGSRPRLAS